MSEAGARAERHLILARRARAMAAASDVDELCRLLLEAVEETVGCRGAAALVHFRRLDQGEEPSAAVDEAAGRGRHAEAGELEVLAVRGEVPGVAPGLVLAADSDEVVAREARRALPEDGTAAESTGTTLRAPILEEERVVGAVVVLGAPPREYDEEDRARVLELAAIAGIAWKGLSVRDRLEREKAWLEALLESSADAIVATDHAGRVTFFSRGAREMFGYRSDDVLGRPVSEFYVDGERAARRVQSHLDDDGSVRNLEARFEASDGRHVPASLSASRLIDAKGRVLGTLGVLKDVTLEKRLERRLSYTIEMLQEANESLGRMAVTDSLSGLGNQRFFHRKLEEELLRSARTARPVTLLLIDIDKFKSFNDTFGHQVGDRVIQEMGETVLRSIRQIDHGCRYGGEEFTVILPETGHENGRVVAERIRAEFTARAAWSELDLAPPTLSIGLAEFIGDGAGGGAGGVDTDALVRAADEAMYRVKGRGGDGIEGPP